MKTTNLFRSEPDSQLTPEKKGELLAQYRRMREAGIGLIEKFNDLIGKNDLLLAAESLGLLEGGKICLGSESESVVLMDYCIFDVRRDGKNLVERFISERPPVPENDEWQCLQGMRNSVYSLYFVVSIIPCFGAVVRDLIGSKDHLLIDVGFGLTGENGLFFASRLFFHDEFAMNSGAMLPVAVVSGREALEMEKKAKSAFIVDDGSPFDPAAIIRNCLSKGASSRVGYQDYRDNAKAAPNAVQFEQQRRKSRGNSVCPCGSGKKYRHCCFKR